MLPGWEPETKNAAEVVQGSNRRESLEKKKGQGQSMILPYLNVCGKKKKSRKGQKAKKEH